MGKLPPRSYAWYDDDDSLEEQLSTELSMAGLPETWRHYEWKIAATLFAALWLVDTWTSGRTLGGMMNVDHFAKGIWNLLVVLTVCAGLFHFWIRRRPSVGYHLCVLIAVAALLGHSF